MGLYMSALLHWKGILRKFKAVPKWLDGFFNSNNKNNCRTMHFIYTIHQSHWIFSWRSFEYKDNSDVHELTDRASWIRIRFRAWLGPIEEIRVILTHRGRVTHTWVGYLTIIISDNGLSPGRQTIIWNNAGILLIRTLGTNFNEILIAIQAFSSKKLHLIMSSAKWRPLCLGLSV